MEKRTLIERLRTFNTGKLPKIVRIKYDAMAENAFRFFRGSCHLFYEDLQRIKLPASPVTWISGDLHLENFGSYRANNKLVYFDLNDFDEALKAPAVWEVIRLLTSIFLAFFVLEIDEGQAINAAALFLRSYCAVLSKGKPIGIEPRTAKGIVGDFLKSAKRSQYSDLLGKRTVRDRRRLLLNISDERHLKLKKEKKQQLTEHINEWIKTSPDGPYNYKVKDVVFRLAGTGSLGVKRYLFLLKSTNVRDRYLLLDMKQAFPSSLAPFVAVEQPSWATEAERIISVQQRMQNVSAALLSSTTFDDESYVIQELQPVKDTIKFKLIRNSYRDLCQVIYDMGVLTASSQLRSGGMGGSAIIDELQQFGSDKSWQKEVIDQALYQSIMFRRYYTEFLKEYRRGAPSLLQPRPVEQQEAAAE